MTVPASFAEPVVATVARLCETPQFGLIHALASVATTPSANVYLRRHCSMLAIKSLGQFGTPVAAREGTH